MKPNGPTPLRREGMCATLMKKRAVRTMELFARACLLTLFEALRQGNARHSVKAFYMLLCNRKGNPSIYHATRTGMVAACNRSSKNKKATQ